MAGGEEVSPGKPAVCSALSPKLAQRGAAHGRSRRGRGGEPPGAPLAVRERVRGPGVAAFQPQVDPPRAGGLPGPCSSGAVSARSRGAAEGPRPRGRGGVHEVAPFLPVSLALSPFILNGAKLIFMGHRLLATGWGGRPKDGPCDVPYILFRLPIENIVSKYALGCPVGQRGDGALAGEERRGGDHRGCEPRRVAPPKAGRAARTHRGGARRD